MSENRANSPAEPFRVSAADTKASEPAMAAGPNGETYLAYVEHRGDGADVVLQPLDADGKPRGERVRVNDESNNAKAWRGDPPTIAVGHDGAIYVGWNKKLADAKVRGNDLMLSISHDGGRSFEAPVRVNDDREPASHGMHSLAVDGAGKIVMAWLDERNVRETPHQMSESGSMKHEMAEPNSEVFAAVSNDGGKTFSANKQIAKEVCPCCKTSMLIAPGGKVYASWRQVLEGDHRHIAVASSDDGGLSFAPGVVVSDDNWQLSACPVSGAALTSSTSDQIEVTWYTAGAAGVAGIYAAKSVDGGKTFGERRLLSSKAATGTPVVGAAFYLFNSPDSAVTARPVDATSTKLGQVDIAGASVPTAVSLKDRTIVAFVRIQSDSPAVWVSSLAN